MTTPTIPVTLADMIQARDAIHLARLNWASCESEAVERGLRVYEQMLDALIEHGRVELVSQDTATAEQGAAS